MEDQVEFVSHFKAWSFWNQFMISIIKFLSKSTKHSSNCQVILMMAIEWCRVKDNCTEEKAGSCELAPQQHMLYPPGPASVSPTLPDHKSPWSSAGSIDTPSKKLDILPRSLGHKRLRSLSWHLYYHSISNARCNTPHCPIDPPGLAVCSQYKSPIAKWNFNCDTIMS